MTTGTQVNSPKPASDSPPARRFAIDSRYVAPLLITSILLAGHISFGILESYPQTLLSIACSIATEIILGLLFYRKIPHLASAYVSGISVGILVRSPYYWPFALCAIISIASKYVLRVKGRHIWNPSNFGIAVMLFLAPATVASLGIQWGNSLGAMVVVWILGSFIVSRLKRFHICATYVLSFFAFALFRSALPGHHPLGIYPAFLSEIAPITGPMYQLYIFFMITDPKSTVHPRWAQCVVAFCVALAECLFRLAGNVHAPYFALFTVGPIANLIEIYYTKMRAPKTDPAAAAK